MISPLINCAVLSPMAAQSLAWRKIRQASGEFMWYNWAINATQVEQPDELTKEMIAEVRMGRAFKNLPGRRRPSRQDYNNMINEKQLIWNHSFLMVAQILYSGRVQCAVGRRTLCQVMK